MTANNCRCETKVTKGSNTFFNVSILFYFVLTVSSCKKLINVTPPSSYINSGNVYANDVTAIAAVTNIYADISKRDLRGGGITSLNLFPGLSSDEISLY